MSTTEAPASYFALPYINTGKITVKPGAREGYVAFAFADDLTLWTRSAEFAREMIRAGAEALKLLDPPGPAEAERIELVPATDEDGNLSPDLVKALQGDGYEPPGCSECGATYTPLIDGRCSNHPRCADRVAARDAEAAKAGA